MSIKTKRPPGYELFFAPLEVVLTPNEYEIVRFAYIVSKFGHAEQKRDDGSRYFDHPKAAAWIYIHELGGRDARLIADLLLHDIAEDTYLLSPYRISLNFGAEIALDVRALTKLPKGKETLEENLGRIIDREPYTITAKLCDRLHNVRTLNNCTEEKRATQIKETSEIHLEMLPDALSKYGGDWTRYSNELRRKILDAINQHQKYP
jgi:GTP pyrophosphokinase